MKKRRLRYLREEAGLSMKRLGEACHPPIAPNYICNAENWGGMYEGHLKRVATALGWDGDPDELLEEVEVTGGS